MYITQEDYGIRINMNLLNMLLEDIQTNASISGTTTTAAKILAGADKIATDTILTKVGVLYEIGNEFTKQGTDRNFYLLSLGLSIALYEIYQRRDDEDIPAKVIKNFNDAKSTLDKISMGKSNVDFPAKTSGTGSNPGGGPEDVPTMGTGLRRLGSQPKRTHRM